MNLRHIGLSLFILLGGCAKMAPSSTHPGARADMGGAAGMAPTDEDSARELAMEDADWDGEAAPAGVMASPEPAVKAPAPEQAVEKPSTDADDGRQIVYTASMVVSVFNLQDAMTKAEGLPDTFGGYIQSMGEGTLVLRLPSKSLRKAMDTLAGFGVVDSRALQAADVTAEFTDVGSRIRALEETQKQLLGLLSKARTVEEALKVRQALDNINGELEVLKGRMRQLKNRISFSTLSVRLYERGPHTPTPSSNDPFPWVNDLGVESTEWK